MQSSGTLWYSGGNLMPTISLRLTERELEDLRAWASDSKRSIQKEVIWRLFTSGPAVERAMDPSVPLAPEADEHFKPDFKRGQK